MDDRENDHLSKPDARMRYGGAPPNVPFLTSTYPAEAARCARPSWEAAGPSWLATASSWAAA